jgi:hypothetical protein
MSDELSIEGEESPLLVTLNTGSSHPKNIVILGKNVTAVF